MEDTDRITITTIMDFSLEEDITATVRITEAAVALADSSASSLCR
jgi:hypothetical protein